MENWKSKDDEMSGEMWKTMKAKTRKIRMVKTRRKRRKREKMIEIKKYGRRVGDLKQ